MRRTNRYWAVFGLCLAGLWAESAAAQSADPGDWFDRSAATTAPPAAGAPADPAPSDNRTPSDYSAPPPDFQSPPSDFQSPPGVSDETSGAAPPIDAATQQQAAEDQSQGARQFSPQLAPYGYWNDDPLYGHVWVPSQSVVGAGFTPYVSAGHWELTPDNDWLWVSDYPFGWITFHYGRWVWCAGGAWGWVPGYVYSPAWVGFRIGTAGYFGWGPLPPYYVWRHGAFVAVGPGRPVPYTYMPTRYAFERSVQPYVVHDRYRVSSIAYQTHPYYGGSSIGYGARVRGPTPGEAHIPVRALPSQRALAQPHALPPSHASSAPVGGNYTVQRYTYSSPSAASPSWHAQPHSYSYSGSSAVHPTAPVASGPARVQRAPSVAPAGPRVSPDPRGMSRGYAPAPVPRVHYAPAGRAGARSSWQSFGNSSMYAPRAQQPRDLRGGASGFRPGPAARVQGRAHGGRGGGR